MKEVLVSFEVAKLAKEAGFDEFTEGYYYPPAFTINDKPRLLFDDANNINHMYYDDMPEGIDLHKYKWNSHHPECEYYCAPTQSILQKWLREIHKIYLHCSYYEAEDKFYMIVIKQRGKQTIINKFFCDTYEQALEEGLKQSLNLIK